MAYRKYGILDNPFHFQLIFQIKDENIQTNSNSIKSKQRY